MEDATSRPLEGIRVLDLGIWRPAPYAGQLLAELGATVTKVEPPGGDPMRAFPSLYAQLNQRKQVVELDLKTVAGRAELGELIARADVVLEGFRPGVAARLGAGPTEVAAANPRAILCSVSGFGQTGPLLAVPGHDLNYQAWTGALAPAGVPAEGELRPSALPLADLAGGTFAALAVSAALARRASADPASYRGEHLDVSMADVLASWAAPEPDGALVDTGEPGRAFPAYGTFRCSDGMVVLGVVTEDRFWTALCHELGLDELTGLDGAERAGRADELRARLVDALRTQERDQLVERLLAAGVPVSPVLSRPEAASLPHFVQRGVLAGGEVRHPVRFGPLVQRPGQDQR